MFTAQEKGVCDVRVDRLYSPKGPRPAGTYSQAVRAGNFLFIAGQGPLDPQTGEIKGETFAEQFRLTLQNIKNIVEGHGGDMRHVVKVNVYLADMANFTEMDAIYKTFFGEFPPARTTVGVQLGDIQIEVEAIAVLSD